MGAVIAQPAPFQVEVVPPLQTGRRCGRRPAGRDRPVPPLGVVVGRAACSLSVLSVVLSATSGRQHDNTKVVSASVVKSRGQGSALSLHGNREWEEAGQWWLEIREKPLSYSKQSHRSAGR